MAITNNGRMFNILPSASRCGRPFKFGFLLENTEYIEGDNFDTVLYKTPYTDTERTQLPTQPDKLQPCARVVFSCAYTLGSAEPKYRAIQPLPCKHRITSKPTQPIAGIIRCVNLTTEKPTWGNHRKL
jgi:hypothetical protein